MAGPFDYSLPGVQTPFQALAGGFQAGAAAAQAQQAREAQQLLIEQRRQQMLQAEQAAQQQQAMQQALSGLMSNPNPTFRDYQNVAVLLPKDQAATLMTSWEKLSTEQKANDLAFGGQVLSAIGKTPEVAVSMLRERATAERNRGRADQAQAYETWAKIAERDPDSARVSIGTMVAQLPGGDKLIESVGKVQQQQRETMLFGPVLVKAEADADKARSDAIKSGVDAQYAPAVAAAGLSKAQSDAIKAASDARFADALNQAGLNEKNWNIRGVQNRINVETQRLGLDRQKTDADVALTLARIGEIANSLPDQAKKDINTAAVASGTAKQQAAQFNSLADKIAAEGGGFGFFSRWTEWAKRATGNEGYVTQLRQEYDRLRNNAAIKSLPPGPATDRDIQLALKPFPESTADAATMASFLRGMAKLQDIDAAVENARVDWLSQNRGSLGRASSAFIAGDFGAKQGETWMDFSARVANDINKRYQQQGTPAGPAGTPMPGIPGVTQTTPPVMSVRDQADAIIRGQQPPRPGGR